MSHFARQKPPVASHAIVGFTLIELLVVITLIAVLLALLMPALDQAIYRAELAVCGTHLKGVSTGVVNYAMENKRWYPYRSGVHDLSHYWSPFSLAQGANNVTHDDRPELRPYVSINGMFNDPLCPKVDFDNSSPEAWLWTPYNTWFGFQYAVQPLNPTVAVRQDRGMLKMGDVLEWSNQQTLNPPEKYTVLVSDMYWSRSDVADYVAAHPDSLGLMTTWSLEDQAFNAQARAQNNDVDGRLTVTRWNLMGSGVPPGRFDFNYGFDDGSVSLHGNMAYDEYLRNDRISRVGATSRGGAFEVDWQFIARR